MTTERPKWAKDQASERGQYWRTYAITDWRDLRERRGLKPGEAAEALGISSPTLRRIEEGTHRVAFNTVRMLCAFYLGMPVYE